MFTKINHKAGSVFIIAEAGVNHNGDIDLAKKMVDAALIAQADAVKFQTFRASELVVKGAGKAEYQSRNLNDDKISHLEMLEALELTDGAFLELRQYCDDKGIEFLSTPFDFASADFLDPLVRLFKISSTDCNNTPFLSYIAKKGKPVILSTGMADVDEIRAAVIALSDAPHVTLLHCTTNYPCPMAEVNLRAMQSLRREFGVDVGYSDHTQGIEVSIAAAALGARVIEKHFTLDRNLPGPDHKASLEPCELAELVKGVRNIELALGCDKKTPQLSERAVRQVARKSIVFSRNLSAGSAIGREDLALKRPGTGLPPDMLEKVLGRILKESANENDFLSISMLEE